MIRLPECKLFEWCDELDQEEAKKVEVTYLRHLFLCKANVLTSLNGFSVGLSVPVYASV